MRKPRPDWSRLWRRAAAAVLAATLAACTHSAVAFNTQLGAPGPLAPGNPVTISGAEVGSVATMQPGVAGRSQIGFTVDHAHADQVRTNSVAVLRQDTTPPSLDIQTPTLPGDQAAANSYIIGASDPNQASVALGAGSISGFVATVGKALTVANVAMGTVNTPATWAQFQNNLTELERQAALAGVNGAYLVQQQLPFLEQQAAAFQQQLERQGRSAEAQKLRDEINKLAATAGSPPPYPSSSSTAIIPSSPPLPPPTP